MQVKESSIHTLRLHAFDFIPSSDYQLHLQEAVWEETVLEWAMQTPTLVGVMAVEQQKGKSWPQQGT